MVHACDRDTAIEVFGRTDDRRENLMLQLKNPHMRMPELWRIHDELDTQRSFAQDLARRIAPDQHASPASPIDSAGTITPLTCKPHRRCSRRGRCRTGTRGTSETGGAIGS